MINPLLYCAALFSLFMFTGAAHGSDLSAGKAKAEATCQTCHGMDGIGNIAGVPNISGQKKDYMMIQLEAYRASQRQHPQMSIIASMLSDEDIDNVSEWYSNIEVTVKMPE